MSRFISLATAETIQLFRNNTVLSMALLIPLGIPLFIVFRGGEKGIALEIFYVFMLLYVVFYPVLVMAVTRRDEGVLKRLRTSGASKFEILSALVAPSVCLGLLLSLIMFVFATPALPQILGLAPAIVTSISLAFICTAFTKNAEAAMLTSAPGFIVLMSGMSTLRSMASDKLRMVLDYSPFALFLDADASAPWKFMLACLWSVFGIVVALRTFKWNSYR
ncbi:hypothetical protein QVA66_09590 [Staphylococcus chromogenes]|nr:hypothetical protein [Staphylococcus chromogenes]